jgi:hypothetical protein
MEDRAQELPISAGLVACRAGEATQVTLCDPHYGLSGAVRFLARDAHV